MYAAERLRAGELRARHPHAEEILTLYLALLDVWEATAGHEPEDVLPEVVRATVEYGPPPLAEALGRGSLDAPGLLDAWLAGEDLAPIERYLARAALRGAAYPQAREQHPRRCPACGGRPQLSYRTDSDDPLVSGQRMLQCARCAGTWAYSATLCPGCGEGRRVVYAEGRPGARVGRDGWERVRMRGRPAEPPPEPRASPAVFPHVRAEACESCRRYLIDIDLGRDPRAVPEVDELAALPLDLHVAEQGLTKITPNLMGF